LALVTMLQLLEEEFGVRVGADDLDLDLFRTISRIATFLERRVVAQAPYKEAENGRGSSVR
jgi:acyl carrier protein